MCNDSVAPIIVTSNYSGACGHVPPSNEDLLKITNPKGCIIHGSTLFALKYRMLPCILKQKPYTNQCDCNSKGISIPVGQRCTPHKKPGLYVAARSVNFF